MSTLFRRLLPLGLLLSLAACDDAESGAGFEVQAIAERTRGNAPLRVGFRTRTNGPLDAAYSFAWNFDDGTTSDDEEPVHLFASPGNFQVVVDVTASPGGRGQGTVEVEVLPSADLDVGEVLVVPQRAQAGEEVTLSFGVRNAGADVVGSWDLVLFLSSSPVYDAQANVLEVIARADDPTSAAYQGDERRLTLPADLPSGEWFVGVAADPNEIIGDSDRTNNVAFAPFPLEVRNPTQNGPDLTICGLDVPGFADVPVGRQPQLEQGSQVPMNVCLGNVGDQPVGLASYVLMLSQDKVPDASDRVVGRRAELPLGTGDREDFEEILDIPGDLATGTWFLIAQADPDDGVAERDEGNNVRVLSGGFLVVEPGEVEGVDLAVTTLSVDQPRAFWGQRLTGQVEVRNRGSVDVQRPFPIKVVALPIDGGAERELATINNTEGMAAGAGQVFAIDISITRLVAAGSYRLAAVADPDNASGDVNRTNNRRTLQEVLELGGQPDFDPAVADVTVDAATVDAGSMLAIAGRLENRGGDDTGPFEVAIVFSQDATFEPTDFVAGTIMVPGLAGGAEQPIEETIVVPFELDQQVGVWRVGLMADPGNALVGEADEANNFAFAREPVQVNGATGGCNEDDENEDNDIPQANRRIGGGRLEGLGLCDEADWFSVRVPAGRVFEVVVQWDPADGLITLRQADSAGQPIRGGEGVDGVLRLFEPAGPQDVTYYFEIAGGGVRLQYDLSVAVVDPGEGPNLRPRAVTPVPAIARAGAPIEVAFEVVNAGGGAAPASRARVDLLVGDQVVQLGEADVSALDPSTFAAVQIQAVLPDGLADGRYFVRVTADPEGALEEGSEADNEAAAILRIDQAQACRADALEPNSSEGGAAVLRAGQASDLNTCDGDDDWYAVDLIEGQRLNIEAAFTHADGDIELELYGPGPAIEGAVCALAPPGLACKDTSNRFQNLEQVELLRAPANGRYFVRAFLNPADQVNVSNTYDLAVSIGDADDCLNDGYQPNGRRDQAALLPDGEAHALVLCPGDEDWFRFPIPAGNVVSFRGGALNEEAVTFTLFGPDGEQLAEDDSRIVHEAAINGMYTLRITAASADRVEYTLRVDGVSGVDLAVDQVRLSANRAAPGDALRADVTVSNRRGDTAEDVEVNYLFSLDQNASPNDVVLARGLIPRIEGAEILAVQQRLTLPDDLQLNDGFVIVVLDPNREVADLRPANNLGNAPLTVVAACEDDDPRNNESPATATPLDGIMSPLAGGVICANTEDWYALPAGAGQVTVELRFQHARGDLDLSIEAMDGLLLGESSTEGDVERVSFVLAAPDTVFIRVFGFLDAENTYSLSWTLP